MPEVILGHCALCGAPVFADDYLAATCRTTCQHGLAWMQATQDTLQAIARKEAG